MPTQRTVTTTVYKFAELSEDAQQAALDRYRDFNADHEWWDFVFEDAKECGAILGIRIDRIYFRGFSSQGDGACFEGGYYYAKGAVRAIRKHAPGDETLAQIAQTLQDVQRGAFYALAAAVKHCGHYYHENCTSIDVEIDRPPYSVSAEQEEAIKEALRDFMRWIYRRLEAEYEYLTSDEQVRESLEANECGFTEDGRIYR